MTTVTDKVLLRKFTRRSKIRESGTRYEGRDVQDLIDNAPGAIAYIYYYVKGITFTDDVLDEVKIFPEDRFDKPGRNIRMYKERKKKIALYHARRGDWSMYSRLKSRDRKVRKLDYLISVYECRCKTSKGYLQRVNQGH